METEKRGEGFCFISWAMSTKLLTHSFRRHLPLHHLHLCPHQCQCIMRKMSLESVTSAWERQSVWVGGWWGGSGSETICNLIWSSGEDCWGWLCGTGQGWDYGFWSNSRQEEEKKHRGNDSAAPRHLIFRRWEGLIFRLLRERDRQKDKVLFSGCLVGQCTFLSFPQPNLSVGSARSNDTV